MIRYSRRAELRIRKPLRSGGTDALDGPTGHRHGSAAETGHGPCRGGVGVDGSDAARGGPETVAYTQ